MIRAKVGVVSDMHPHFHSSPFEPFPQRRAKRRLVIEQASGEGCSTGVLDSTGSGTPSFLGRVSCPANRTASSVMTQPSGRLLLSFRWLSPRSSAQGRGNLDGFLVRLHRAPQNEGKKTKLGAAWNIRPEPHP
jgi:hypothetical protein